MDYFLSVLGLVLIIEGIPYFAFHERMKEMLSRLPLIPSSSLRAFGIVAILIGFLMIYVARKLL